MLSSDMHIQTCPHHHLICPPTPCSDLPTFVSGSSAVHWHTGGYFGLLASSPAAHTVGGCCTTAIKHHHWHNMCSTSDQSPWDWACKQGSYHWVCIENTLDSVHGGNVTFEFPKIQDRETRLLSSHQANLEGYICVIVKIDKAVAFLESWGSWGLFPSAQFKCHKNDLSHALLLYAPCHGHLWQTWQHDIQSLSGNITGF